MVIQIPASNSKRLIFPYLELSNSFGYSHYNPEITKYRLSMDTLDNFFVSIHKYTANDFERIALTQKLILFAYPTVFIILVVFGTLLGVYYKGNTEPFIVRFSAGIILASSGFFLLWLVYVLLKIRSLKNSLISKIRNVIQETNMSFAKARVRWVLPKLDFPHWIELWFDGSSSPFLNSTPNTPQTNNSPNIQMKQMAKYDAKESPRPNNLDMDNHHSPEKIGLIIK